MIHKSSNATDPQLARLTKLTVSFRVIKKPGGSGIYHVAGCSPKGKGVSICGQIKSLKGYEDFHPLKIDPLSVCSQCDITL